MKNFVNHIIRNNIKCYFVSPHRDDAIFSCGGLIYKLRSNDVPVTIINVFTESGLEGDSLSAKAFVRQCGYTSSKKLFNDRLKEDRKIMKLLGVQFVDFNMIDALWRTKNTNLLINRLSSIIPELKCLYPTYRWHISKGVIRKEDRKLENKLYKLLIERIEDGSIVFAPFGIGNHVDHLLVRNAIKNINITKLYWMDYPYYILNINSLEHLKLYRFTPNWTVKESLIKNYKTQYHAVFGNYIIKKDELYCFK